MSEFDKKEQVGRELLEKVLIAGKAKKWWFSTDKASIWDAKYITDDVLNIVEIKVRNQNYNTYPDWIIELKKCKALSIEVSREQLTTDKKVSAYYINFFNDGYFAIWCINRIDFSKVEIKWCKATTAIKGKYVEKEIIPLKISDAVLFGQIQDNKIQVIEYEETTTT